MSSRNWDRSILGGREVKDMKTYGGYTLEEWKNDVNIRMKHSHTAEGAAALEDMAEDLIGMVKLLSDVIEWIGVSQQCIGDKLREFRGSTYVWREKRIKRL